MPTIATEDTFSCVSYASARSAYDSNEGAKQGYFGASRREKRALQTPLPCKDKPRSHAMLRDDVRGNTPKRRRDSNARHSAWKAAVTFRKMLNSQVLTAAYPKPPTVDTTVARGIRRSTATSAT